MKKTRREMLTELGRAAAGLVVVSSGCHADGQTSRLKPEPRVAIARDVALTRGSIDKEHRELIQKMLDGAVQKITGLPDPARAWGELFGRRDRVGIKVNTLGLSTHPVVVDAIVAGLHQAGLKDENILIWDRFAVELNRAGFKLNQSGRGARCRGTDADSVGRGYQRNIEVSGRIGSCYSHIVSEEVDALISVPVLKDHNLAGVSLGMKNFYGAIHNPNKYHDDNCDPYIADVVSHRFIAPKWRLTVCDGTRAQYHNGPGPSPGYRWPFGGLIVGADFVATDAVAASILEAERKAKGLPSLAEENRPTRHITTAGARELGEANLNKIEQFEV
jgi:uncharacterized protein (DUF362 family)